MPWPPARRRFGPAAVRSARSFSNSSGSSRTSARSEPRSREAAAAARDAALGLTGAREQLRKASGWSTYDTIFGGGFVSSLIKHDRIDDAATAVSGVQHSLQRLRAELIDVDLDIPVAELSLPSGTLRNFDVLFDNFLSDWMVHDHITASEHSIDAALRDVRRMQRRLDEIDGELANALEPIASRRDEILRPS